MRSRNKPESLNKTTEPSATRVNLQAKAERQIRAYQQQLRRLASELSLAEARERREIASELHDHIGQALAYVSQKVTVLQGNAVFSGMEDDFVEILSILSQTIEYTRNLTVEISPPVLYELGLSAAIDWLADRATERYGFYVVQSQSGSVRDISDDTRVFMFKAVQELIANIAKHAQAVRVEIATNWYNDKLEIVVSDNGKGFDTSSLDNRLVGGDCFGLFSIRERLSYIGGELKIESTLGKGTKVSLTIIYNTHAEVDHD